MVAVDDFLANRLVLSRKNLDGSNSLCNFVLRYNVIQTMARKPSPHPEWATKFRRPGTELRCIKGRYCLYECRCVYDKETKRHRKITGKYLGSITEKDGFKLSKKRLMEAEMEKLRNGEILPLPQAKVGEVKEYGLSWLITNGMQYINDRLKKDFPNDYRRIIALAYSRLRCQSPMRDVQADFSDSFLSTQTGTAGLLPSQLSGFLYDLGGQRGSMVGYMDHFCSGSSNVIFDGTDLLGASRLMGLPQLTKTKAGTFEKAVNLMMVYSLDMRLPAYYRLLPGNIKDVKALRICMSESGASSAIAIMDKTFPARKNLEFLEKEEIKYIASLKRSTKGLDYSVFDNRTNNGLDGHFTYHGRVLWYKELSVGARRVVMYLDEEHRIEENRDYINRVDSGKYEDYTLESYHAKACQFGTIALVTNTDMNPRQLYEAYKTRCEVEQAIDVFKTNLDADSSYMQSERSLEAYTFINFIALQWYYIIRERLRQAEKLDKYSPMQMVKMLSRIRTVYVDGKWTIAEMTKKQTDLMKEIGWSIT